MKENHTEREDHTSHRFKESRSKKNQKIVKRSLSTAFSTGTEEVSSEKTSELSSSSGTADGSVSTFTPPVSSEALSDLTISSNSADPFDMYMDRCVFHKLDSSVEVDIVLSFLKKARNQVFNSSDVDKQSKKIVDTLLKVVVEECCALPEEKDLCAELLSVRGRILLLCFLLWTFMLSVIFFFGALTDRSHHGPLPT